MEGGKVCLKAKICNAAGQVKIKANGVYCRVDPERFKKIVGSPPEKE